MKSQYHIIQSKLEQHFKHSAYRYGSSAFRLGMDPEGISDHLPVATAPHQRDQSDVCAIEIHRPCGNILKVSALPVGAVSRLIIDFMVQITPQHRILWAVEPVDFRNYVKSSIMCSDWQIMNSLPMIAINFSAHNSRAYFFAFSMARSLSGALNFPGLSDNGLVAISISSFPVGSDRK
jgi:hypothetical protein